MTKLKLFEFTNKNIIFDTFNEKGKITKYYKINIVAKDEESARVKGKLSEEYELTFVKELGKDWYQN